jgi:hypothetical protein
MSTVIGTSRASAPGGIDTPLPPFVFTSPPARPMTLLPFFPVVLAAAGGDSGA